ncbi:MotE family protein [Saliterribacillus persicus]|uniref:Flagellar motility protein MotE (MotC chaperone) n=1 Tax=Saliterribacillus persicus TaxID=930114 RepID=A0A368XS71_9BACI|nr:hypothetical protein [Saliterribacillus persicus]RCW70715.1 hypothetical protein DFR57_106112 [Saliterribacillus persicus]
MKKDKQNKEKKAGLFQWVVVITFPLFLASIIAFILLSVLGVDVFTKSKETLNKIPFVSTVVTTDEEEQEELLVEQKDTEIENHESEIEALNNELFQKDNQIEDLEIELESLQAQLEALNSEEEEVTVNMVEEITGSFKNMEAASAGAILTNMEEEAAVEILQSLSAKDRGSILGEMDPEIAASLSSNFITP